MYNEPSPRRSATEGEKSQRKSSHLTQSGRRRGAQADHEPRAQHVQHINSNDNKIKNKHFAESVCDIVAP